ncbi:hypothetical protein [Phosphitispora fastidiosa]|uniref:hypothetical protein n=1 Tax=Phosphitispora fastidiosa TaxID=2837202 RepID=UPI001E3D25B9|nr:hypothetical protein [Phosphitispora fastidiosa]MBU7008684.1 hypothetical protein [Phosphitispora fastidiosa]
MTRKPFVLGLVLLTSLVFVSGCSFNLSKLSSILPSREKPETVSDKVYQNKSAVKAPAKSREALQKELDSEINLVVDQIMAGRWNEAINLGEAAYEMVQKEHKGNADSVNSAVYDAYGYDAAKEKLYEVLSAAYDFKYHLEGLNNTEKERYVRTAKAHFDIDPSDPFKKLALAKAQIDTGDMNQGLGLLGELYNSQFRDKDITESYAWALYLSGRKDEAYNIYRAFYPQSETLIQLFHSAQVIEEKDKALGLNLYNGVTGAANNLMVKDPNVNNMSAQTYIDQVRTGSRNASERLLAGGFKLNSQYNLQKIDPIVKSIVKLSGE